MISAVCAAKAIYPMAIYSMCGKLKSAFQNHYPEGSDLEKKPVLLSPTRSIKIVDLRVHKRHRQNPEKCRYCGKPIAKYALSKTSKSGTRYYLVDCAIRVGFGITV